MRMDYGIWSGKHTSTLPAPQRAAACCLGLCLACGASQAVAQAVAPDAGSLLRNIEKPARLPTPAPALSEPEAVVRTPQPGEASVVVKSFRISGATRMDAAQLQQRLAPWVGRSLSLSGLEDATRAVVGLYREHGYVARAQLPAQTIQDGIVDIAVVEGKLGRVLSDTGGKTSRLAPQRASAYIHEQTAPGEPIKLQQLERGMLLLRDLPGSNIAGTLEAGAREGEIDVHLTLSDAPLLSGSVAVNNSGTPSTGSAQVDAQVNINGAAGRGEQWNAHGLAATGLDYGRAGLTLPLGYGGWAVGASLASMRYRLGDRFASLAAGGHAETAGASASYPIERSRERNTYASINAERKHYVNTRLGNSVSDKRVDALALGFVGSSVDSRGVSNYAVTLTEGMLDLSAQAENSSADASSARTQGAYGKFSWNVSRQHSLNNTIAAYAAFAGQVASKNLDSSEKLFLGGPNAVRAYPANEAGGDQGMLLNLELRAMLNADLQGFAFVDAGAVKQNRNLWPGWQGKSLLANRIDLAGAGLGLTWNLWESSLRLSLARRIGSNPLASADGTDSDGAQRNARFWAQYGKNF